MSRTLRSLSRSRNLRRMQCEELERRELLTTLAISEINYAPYAPSAQFGDASTKASDFEFVELVNYGNAPVSLDGVRLTKTNVSGSSEGIEFMFPSGETLASSERVVVVKNDAAFRSRYGSRPRVAGEFRGGLGNSEVLTLLANDETIVEQFRYDSKSPWPSRAAGLGATLERKKFPGNPADPKKWDSSPQFGGTPGQERVDVEAPVVFNEILAHTDLPQVDSIELLNVTDRVVDVSYWYVTDSLSKPYPYSFPAGTSIAPHGYLTIDERDFNAGGQGFALSERGESLWLVSANRTGRPLAYVEHVEFDASLNGVAMGRLPNGNPKSDMLPLAFPTLGSANAPQRISDIVINEVQYNPSNGDDLIEFIELRNATDSPQSVGAWRIRDAVDIQIPEGVVIDAGEVLVLVPFDPADISRRAAFQANYQIGNDVRLVGPWIGKLSNGGDRIDLMMPLDDHGVTVYALADQVRYDDKAPWPLGVDGLGKSLNRSDPASFGNDPLSWVAAPPSPGGRQRIQVVGDVNHDGIFNSTDLILLFQSGEYEDAVPGNSTVDEGDWNGDGDFTSADLIIAFRSGTYIRGSRALQPARSPERHS